MKKKYFYTDGKKKFGPFSFEELKIQNLSRETKVWYYGLNNWEILSEIEELKSISQLMPPRLNISVLNVSSNTIGFEVFKQNFLINKKRRKNRLNFKIISVIFVLTLSAMLFSYIAYNRMQKNESLSNIVTNAYDSDEDFMLYVNKFYRDIEMFGISPQKPKEIIIKFSRFNQLDDTYFHGISCGINNDDLIEIYINPSTWNSFNKPMRYYLMYHELAHDVLNVDDLKGVPMNEGKLMYPAFSTYELKTMDDFIECSHEFFEDYFIHQDY